MKILHFTQDMSAGGVESIICNLLNEMVKQHDVTLATIYAVNKEQTFEQKLDPRIKRITAGKVSQGFSFNIMWKIFKMIHQGKYDVVHIHGWFYNFIFPILLLHFHTKFFYTVHSDAHMENTPMDLKLIKLKRWCFKHEWMRAVTISMPSKQSFLSLYQSPSRLIYNGVKRYTGEDVRDKFNYKLTDKTKVFIHPARISSEKNQLVLVKVFDRLIKEGEDVVLLIAGQIRDAGIFEQLKPYFSDRIKYIGVRSDVPQLMAYSFGFCLPSIWEGLPVTLLEALSSGCIPVCSPVGGVIEVVQHGQNGFLSLDSGEDSYYEVMKCVLGLDENSSIRIKQNCKQAFEKFDIENTARNYLNYYKEVLEEQ